MGRQMTATYEQKLSALAADMGVTAQDVHGFVAGLSLQTRKLLAGGKPFTFEDVIDANQAAMREMVNSLTKRLSTDDGREAGRAFVVNAFFPKAA